MPKSALIVGAGLGGLLCGRILSRKGWEVKLLEAQEQPGGVLSDGGFHSVGGLGPGEPLEIVFRQLGLMDLPWYRADADEGFPFLRLNARTEFEIEHVLAPYCQSVWRLKGGGACLVKALSDGLDISCGKRVESIENQEVFCADGSTFKADVVLSDLHPLTTLQMVRDRIRPAYLHRLQKLENGPDFYTLHCRLEPACVPWQSGAIFLDESLMIHFDEPETGLLELIRFGEGNPEEMIAQAQKRLPELRIKDYQARVHPGYGILKYSNADFISSRTPLPWLFLTGQNLGLHGILGTSISALNTCKSVES